MTYIVRYGQRSLSVIDPRAWNQLSMDIGNQSLGCDIFYRLKTELLNGASYCAIVVDLLRKNGRYTCTNLITKTSYLRSPASDNSNSYVGITCKAPKEHRHRCIVELNDWTLDSRVDLEASFAFKWNTYSTLKTGNNRLTNTDPQPTPKYSPALCSVWPFVKMKKKAKIGHEKSQEKLRSYKIYNNWYYIANVYNS